MVLVLMMVLVMVQGPVKVPGLVMVQGPVMVRVMVLVQVQALEMALLQASQKYSSSRFRDLPGAMDYMCDASNR